MVIGAIGLVVLILFVYLRSTGQSVDPDVVVQDPGVSDGSVVPIATDGLPSHDTHQAIDPNSLAARAWRSVAQLGELPVVEDVEIALAAADSALEKGQLINPPQENALSLYLGILQLQPENEDALEGVHLIGIALKQQVNKDLAERHLTATEKYFPVLNLILPDDDELVELADRLENLQHAEELRLEAIQDLEAGKLIQPIGNNALAKLWHAQELDPEHAEIPYALILLERELINKALEAARLHEFENAQNLIGWADRVRGGSTAVEHAWDSIAQFKQLQIDILATDARMAMNQGQFEVAVGHIQRIQKLAANESEVAALTGELRLSRIYNVFSPGQLFVDSFLGADDQGPDMVVVPHGSFLMGALDDEEGHRQFETPRHRVTFRQGFALSVSEITVAQFKQFIDAADYRTETEIDGSTAVYSEINGRIIRSRKATWRDGFNGRGAKDGEPVVHISWNDAKAYTDWLTHRTGKPYRLPTEAEFEYALRAGSMTRFWWGDQGPTELVENLTGDGDLSKRRREWNQAFDDYEDGFWGPAPASSYKSNGFLLHDMAGNVEEWVEDCWHDSYVRAPTDGQAWVNRGCALRVIRGGFWGGAPATARSAYRTAQPADRRGGSIGFRVARSVVPEPDFEFAGAPNLGNSNH
jgi:formylglycine-generating enzyme required for sulfatase activity